MRVLFLVALLPLSLASSEVKPFQDTDSVVPETELVTSTWCTFSVCPIGSPGYRKDCLPQPDTCTDPESQDWCMSAQCAEGTGDLHYGEAADVAGIQPECYTLHTFGGVCHFDESRTDCAVCKPGACQCGEETAAGRNRCMPCAKDPIEAPPQCLLHVPPPDSCEPDVQGISFTKHEQSSCLGHDKDLLNDYFGSAEQCKAKCVAIGCQGFLFTPRTDNKYASQPYGKCDFRNGPLQPIVSSEGTECYVPDLKE